VDLVCVQLSQLIGLDLEDVRGRGREREDVAEACGVSLTRINKWAAPSKPDHLPPLQFLPLWVRATQSTRLLEWAAAECGYELADPEQQRDAALGRLVRQARGLIEEVLTA
jgi:hypothetical protein